MKKTPNLLTVLLFALIPAAMPAGAQEMKKMKEGDQPKRLAIGAKALMTGTEMLGTDGKQHSIDSVKGEKGTLVIFSCNHCPWVKKWEDRIAEICNAAPAQGIGVIVINSNDTDEFPSDGMKQMKERAKQRSFKFPYVIDATSDVARAFGAQKTPEVFLFDKELKLAYHGAIDDNANNAKEVEEPYLKNAIGALAKGEAIEKKETKAMGCGIKLRPQKTVAEEM